MKLNVAKKSPAAFTHEGGKAVNVNAEAQLRRSVMSCLLWEREFYEDGQTIADRIKELVDQVARVQWKPEKVVEIIRDARQVMHLRHVPLLLTCALAETRTGGRHVAAAIAACVQRADEIAELVAIWWKDGRRPLTAGMKRGLAAAFNNFAEYSLAKYNRDGAVKLRDVMFLVHPKPRKDQVDAFRRLAAGELSSPDTWEVALSAGADKKETFERLLVNRQLGYLALLRNLRNMMDAGCDQALVREAIESRRGAERVLPFRYVAAARACPQLEPAIDEALCASVDQLPRLSGRTIVLVDVSGSMEARLSLKSDLERLDAAAALASIVNCESLRVFTFSNNIVEVPPRRGMAGVDAIKRSQPNGGTYLGMAVQHINENVPHDRIVVITDEQSHDAVPAPQAQHAYMINVASNKHGVGYGKWTHIDGFSENVIRYIAEVENATAQGR